MRKVIWSLFILFMNKEDKEMVAILWVSRIVAGKRKFSDVPRLLKDQVREILIEADLEYLIDED